MIQYKIDVLFELKNNGYSTYKLEKEKILTTQVIHKLRKNGGISFDSLNTLCKLLHCQPGDIIEYIPDLLEAEN